MNIVFTILIMLCPPRPVHVVYVVPAGETFTADEQAAAREQIDQALVWWEARADRRFQVADTVSLTTTADVYHDLRSWSMPYLTSADRLTIFVIDNSESGALIFDNSAGEAQDYYGAIWVVTRGYPGEGGLGAATAHEVGHVVYGLDHPPEPCALDIMCARTPVAAYREGVLGCFTGALLGQPCDKRTYLPFMGG